jgi:hypothetical protein
LPDRDSASFGDRGPEVDKTYQRYSLRVQDGGNIVVLTGPIGAGKSTVASEFMRISPWPFALIEGDEFWKFFDSGAKVKPKPVNFKLLVGATLGAAITIAKGGYNVLIDFTVPPTSSARFLERCNRFEVDLHWVTLSPELDVCRLRAKSRVLGQIDEYSFYEEFFASFLDSPTPPLDNSSLSPGAAADQILIGLKNGVYRLD